MSDSYLFILRFKLKSFFFGVYRNFLKRLTNSDRCITFLYTICWISFRYSHRKKVGLESLKIKLIWFKQNDIWINLNCTRQLSICLIYIYICTFISKRGYIYHNYQRQLICNVNNWSLIAYIVYLHEYICSYICYDLLRKFYIINHGVF